MLNCVNSIALPGQSLSPQARAQQLAEVAVAVYEAGCSAIHLPLEPSNPLLAILKQALEHKGSERAVGQALASALLENVLQAVEEQTDSFPALIVSRSHCMRLSGCLSICLPVNLSVCACPTD